MALSPTMRAALRAILDAGGEAHPIQGGWWSGTPGGPRLTFAPQHGAGITEVLTNTVYALRSRGYLDPIPDSGNHVHGAFRATAKAREDQEQVRTGGQE